jgi:CBS domain-containing protein
VKDLTKLRNTEVRNLAEERSLFSDDEKVSRAIGHLEETREYEVFVKRSSKLAGANLKDFLSVSNPESTRLGNISYLVPTLRPTDSVGKAARLMYDYRLRAIPIGSGNAKVQVVSAWRLTEEVRTQGELSIKATDVMTPNPVTISPTDTVGKARGLMLRRAFDHLPVLENSSIRGILTSMDILMNLPPPERFVKGSQVAMGDLGLRYPVSRIAGPNPLQIEPEADLSVALERMASQRSSYVLLVLWGELQGIITLRDVTQVLVPREKSQPPYYIVGLPDEPFEAETAKMKFARLTSLISKAYPTIEEVRAVIKSKEITKDRRRYEVSVNVLAPKALYAYSENGYDLSEVFDALAPKMKKLLSSRSSRVTKSHGESSRKGEAPA